jgi:DNA-binding NarL/FixJ family response regulator
VPTPPIRVALVDDQALFRTGVRMLISSQPDLEFAGEAANGQEAVDLARRERPDVILMDIRMPVMDGIQATAEVLRAADARGDRPPRVLVLTTFDLDESAARAIRAGASGFVLKDADPEFLLAAIRTVHAGNSVIAASATRQLLEHFDPGSQPRVEVLARPQQRGDRAGRVPQRGDGEDARQPDPREAQPPRPRAARGLRVRAPADGVVDRGVGAPGQGPGRPAGVGYIRSPALPLRGTPCSRISLTCPSSPRPS